ncbi:MAG TPA: TolC family outer membrane protein [Sphingomicrobium sp.]|nr:TolC family outer membrane protein [Sphingomicrobium sp.]
MPLTRPLILPSLVAALATGAASADTLREALVSAYETNPTLTAQRQALKGTDAAVAAAKAQGRPTVSATAGLNENLASSGVLIATGSNATVNAGVDLSVPLFNGGAVRNGVQAAKIRVLAGRETLRGVEGTVFTDAVTAYMDVIRDRAIVELNQNNVKVLETNLQATQDRFQIGDVTRTDVAQSQARLELGRSDLATAQGRLTSSEENYRRVIGHEPGDLQPPPPLPPLPATADEAVQIALAANPDLHAIRYQAAASAYDVRVAEASRLPTLSGVASETYVKSLGGSRSNFPTAGNQITAGLSARVPLYQGGLPSARIREAQSQQGQLLEQSVGTERSVIDQARSAFATFKAANDAIASEQVAVQANQLALEGARAEQTVGTRTVLDVLNAEQELLNSQVSLVTARHDAYVAGFQLLEAMGQADSTDLGLSGGPLYDPLGNYRHVSSDWNDWSTDPTPAPIATRTVTPQELPQGVTSPKQ